VAECGAVGAMFQLPIKMELMERNALIKEITHIIAMIFSIPTSAPWDGNALIKLLANAPKPMKAKVSDQKIDAKNIANQSHHHQNNTDAISPTTNVKNATKMPLTAKKTEEKLVTNASLHHPSSSDATEPIRRIHHARSATQETKAAETKSRYAKTAHHQPNS
jgi:hypothetical protein